MNFIKTKLDGVYIIEQTVFSDDRGCFVKTFHEDTFKEKGLESNFSESFYSESKKNVIRGMHFQTPSHDHAKMATVIVGKIIDVILDIRTQSPTYGEFITVELSRENRKSVYIPKGLAHGFVSLVDDSVVYYMTSTVYAPKNDGGIRWDSFGYDWNIQNPIISERDKSFEAFSEYNSPFNN